MPSILRNEDLSRKLDHEGYTTFRLLPEQICSSLLKFYQQHSYENEAIARGFSTGLDQRDKSNSQSCSAEILHQIVPYLSDHIKDYQMIISTFIVKSSGAKMISPLHQDWTFVDEQKHSSYTLWCPLHDVDLDNGTLGVLPKSHHLLGNAARPSPCPPYVPVFSKYMMDFFAHLRFLSLAAGEVVLFDHRCWHGAMPNLSASPRVAIGISLTHKDAALEHHYLVPHSSRATVLAVDKSFFYTYNNETLLNLHQSGAVPQDYEQLRSYEFEYPQLDAKALLRSLREASDPSQEVLDRLATLQKDRDSDAEDSNIKADPPSAQASTSEEKRKHLPIWKVYTPRNILLELKHRLYSKSSASPEAEPQTEPQTEIQEQDQSNHKDTVAAVGAFYDAHHKQFMNTYGSVIQAFRTRDIEDMLNYELKQIDIKAGDVVLDAGCGICGPALYFSKRVSCRLHAITISEEQYKEAYLQIKDAGDEQIELHLGDYHEMQHVFGSAVFDRIYFLESWGHSTQKKRLLSSSWKALKPGGIVYIKDLFRRVVHPGYAQHQIDALISAINAGYCYAVNELNELLDAARAQGFIVRFVKTIDIELDQFEDLSISNHFQNLTGINRTSDWNSYVFPVDFMELVLYKPSPQALGDADKYFLQNLLRAQAETRK